MSNQNATKGTALRDIFYLKSRRNEVLVSGHCTRKFSNLESESMQPIRSQQAIRKKPG
jgi:hypothetical protein